MIHRFIIMAVAAILPGLMLAAPAIAQPANGPFPCTSACIADNDAGQSIFELDATGQTYSIYELGDGFAYFNPTLWGDAHGGGSIVTSTWPFTDTRFDNLYSGWYVIELHETGDGGVDACMATDSAYHSGQIAQSCANSGFQAYVVYGRWWVNVQATNHIDNYPYGEAIFADQADFLIHIANGQPSNGYNGWAMRNS